jgi:hypothetical protein
MFIQVYYSTGKAYGPEKNVPKYDVRLRRQSQIPRTIFVDFLFGDGVAGRGTGELRGSVKQGFLHLPEDSLRTICERINDFLDHPDRREDTIPFHEK